MNNFIKDIKKLLISLFEIEEDFGQYSDKSLDSGIKTARAIKCYKNSKDVSYYVTKFKDFDLDKRDFIRIVIEIPCQNNLRSKNIDLILSYMRLLESYFIYTDYIKLYIDAGIIRIDTYRENKFPEDLFKKEN